MVRTKSYFNVRPRYSPGSPAMVSEDIARRVAEEERQDYSRRVAGYYGEKAKLIAEQLGIGPRDGRSIVEEVFEHSNHWLVRDLLTDELYQRPFETISERQRTAISRCPKCLAARERARAAQK